VSFFLDLVDLLLQSAGAAPAAPQRTALLQEARETMELLKVAELQNYFRQDCVDPAPSEPVRLDDISPRAAVIYPILLPERTEVLVGTAAGMSRHVAAVGQARVTAVIRELRRTLQKRTTFQYLQPSRQLYDWLIRPLEPELAEGSIDTLVFVPYGALGTVPPSALHDGSNFLIEKYAVAITPGLRLTDPRAFRRDEVRPFLAGLTEPVQGFPPLANAGEELRRIHEIYGGEILIDEQFRVARVEKELENERFDVVHIASHGEFRSDADDTFLLTFDGKLTMNGLSDLVSLFRHREDRLELLALSACETAVGDDRAALGLAGVAVRAGAKSALATLWYVDDQASARLVTEFYRQLRDPALSKAAALQRAQLSLMSHRPYRHPAYWSPYLLINNWL
jgi:CHAT domain-containing protein